MDSKRRIIRKQGDVDKRKAYLSEEVGALSANPTSDNIPLVVFGQTTTTNTPVKSTESTSGKSTKETSEQLMLLEYQNTTSSVRDFLAKVSQLLGSEEDLKIREAHYSLRYAECYGLKDLVIYSLRMLKDSSLQTEERSFKPSLCRWMNLGMTFNGRCLTARTSVSPRTGRGCSLSDILEENPDQKYFLSEKQTKHIQKVMRGEVKFHQQDKIHNPETDIPNLPAGTHGSTPHLMKIQVKEQ